MRDAPAASCAKEKHTSKSPQVRRGNPAPPARVVLTASFVISSVNGLCCHRRRPRCKSIVGRLDASVAASGPHDFAVCRWCFVRRKVLAPDTTCIHRIPRPTFVTIAKRPSWRARDAGRGASDLPDVTSENDCDRMARRANQCERASRCQARSRVPNAMRRMHDDGPLISRAPRCIPLVRYAASGKVSAVRRTSPPSTRARRKRKVSSLRRHQRL